MIQFPKNKMWTQLNGPDNQGDFWASFNIDTAERESKVRVGKRMVVNINTADNASLTSYPVGFVNFLGNTYTVAGLSSFVKLGTYPNSASFSAIATFTPNADSTTSDIALFPGNSNGIWIAQKSNVVAYSADGTNWFGLTVGGADNTSAHSLCYYNSRMYFSSLGSLISSWDSSNSIKTTGDSAYTLQLGDSAQQCITSIRAGSDRLWICTVNTLGGKGYVYEWDGILANTPTKAHRLESAGALSCVIKDDVPYIMDTNGALFYWNGGTFVKLTQLNRKNNKSLYNALSTVNNRFIHPNGMSVIQGRINILIDGRNYTSTGEVEETISSGIYEFDTDNPTKGLIHKHSFGLSHSGDSISDWGQIRINGAGGLAEVNIPNASANRNGIFLAGASYFKDASNTSSGIFYDDTNDTLQKVGSFISSKIEADDASPYHFPSVENTWESLYTLYKTFTNPTDKIVLKYRTTESDTLQNVSITWTSTNTFTTTTNLNSYLTPNLKGEVEVIQGAGSGYCAHITKIDQSVIGGTTVYTVTLDDTIPNVSGTALVRVGMWKKIGTIINNNQIFNSDTISDKSTWIQLKVWMLFTGKDQIEKLILNNLNTTPVK